MKRKIPAVSIIIPMYNTEKYIGECLDSILAQTFTDYEVIVVDDCSTDKSCAVVESYLPKFNRGEIEKLSLMKSQVHSSGCPGVPRNTGIRLSRGEYIWFIDSDDAITPNALEYLYTMAKKFDADVVHCEKYFQVENDKFTTNTINLKADAIIKADFISEPTLMATDKFARLKDFANEKFDWSTVTNFIRRNFIAKNNLEFITNIQSFEDSVFAVKLLCRANRILKVPNAIYLYRRHSNSITKSDLPVENRVHRAISNAGFIIKEFDKIFSEFEKQVDFQIKFTLFDMILRRVLNGLFSVYAQIPAHLLDSLIRRELDKIGDKTALTASLFARINVLNVQLNRQAAVLHNLNVLVQYLQAELNKLKN